MAPKKRVRKPNTVKGTRRGSKWPEWVKTAAMADLLVNNNRSDVARRYGVPESTLRTWETAARKKNPDQQKSLFDQERERQLRELNHDAAASARASVAYIRRRLETSAKNEAITEQIRQKLDSAEGVSIGPEGVEVGPPGLDESEAAALRGAATRYRPIGDYPLANYGDWDLFEGQFFSEFRREVHVCEPFPIPAHWRRYVVIDYGMDMLAGLWIAVNEQGRAWAYREVYEGRDNGKGKDGKGHIVRDAAARLKALTPADEQIYCWLAPPDLWGRNKDTGKSTAEIFAESGIYFEKASASRVDGWRAVHEWLALNKDEQGNMVPGLMIFSTCTNLIRTLPAVQFDPKNSEDVANEPHELTHAPDALRYFCASWTSPAEQQKEEKKTIFDYFTDDDQQGDPLGWGDEIHVI